MIMFRGVMLIQSQAYWTSNYKNTTWFLHFYHVLIFHEGTTESLQFLFHVKQNDYQSIRIHHLYSLEPLKQPFPYNFLVLIHNCYLLTDYQKLEEELMISLAVSLCQPP